MAALAALAAHTPAGRTDAAAVLAFAYSIAATRGGHPSHDPAGSHLDGATDLTGWWIDGADRRLNLRGLSLTGADLTEAVLRTWACPGLTTSQDSTARIWDAGAVRAPAAPSHHPVVAGEGELGLAGGCDFEYADQLIEIAVSHPLVADLAPRSLLALTRY